MSVCFESILNQQSFTLTIWLIIYFFMISEESLFLYVEKVSQPTVFYSNHMIDYLFISWFQRKFFTFMVKKCLKSAVCYMSYHVFLFNHSCTEKFLLSTNKLGISISTAVIYINPSCGNLNIRSVLGLLLLLR